MNAKGRNQIYKNIKALVRLQLGEGRWALLGEIVLVCLEIWKKARASSVKRGASLADPTWPLKRALSVGESR